MKLLQLFYSNPNRPFYVREITRKIDEQINSVRRELANLLSVGIIKSENNNNKLYYEVNQSYEYHEPLTKIFGEGVTATQSPERPQSSEAHNVQELGNVKLAFYTGQFTRDESAGVDFVIIGDVNQTQVEKFIEEVEKREGKEIRYAVMTGDEFAYRRQVNDRFAGLIDTAKKQIVIDKDYVYTDKPSEPQSEKDSKKKKSKSKE